MILVFDLDDTLYNEETYVLSGFKAVSNFLTTTYKLSDTSNDMFNYMKENGRGKVFDYILHKHDLYTKTLIRKCISIYRLHRPNIELSSEAKDCLERFEKYKKYIVTDGNKIVQKNKIEALNLKKYIAKSYITYQYGKKYSKPSIYCFELIKQKENCNFEDIIYLGDNPNKDFINIKKVGCKTIRVNQGYFKNRKYTPEQEAHLTIQSLNEFTEDTICKLIS